MTGHYFVDVLIPELKSRKSLYNVVQLWSCKVSSQQLMPGNDRAAKQKSLSPTERRPSAVHSPCGPSVCPSACPSVRPSVRSFVRPSIRPGARPPGRPAARPPAPHYDATVLCCKALSEIFHIGSLNNNKKKSQKHNFIS